MNRTRLLACIACTLTLVACGGGDDSPTAPADLDLSGEWPELWVDEGPQMPGVPAFGGTPPSITLATDGQGVSGSTCYLDGAARVLVEMRLAIHGQDVVGGDITVSGWVLDPVPPDCTSRPPDTEPVRRAVTGAYVWDDEVRVDGTWLSSTPGGVPVDGAFILERNP